jgi:hypothetical protein
MIPHAIIRSSAIAHITQDVFSLMALNAWNKTPPKTKI